MYEAVQNAIELQTSGDLEGAIALYRSAPAAVRSALQRQTPDGQWIHGPDFLIIGAARAGTTWLKKRLSGVSAIRIKPGEPNYFSFHASTDPRDYVASLCSGVKNADLPHDGSPRLYGEKSPSYLLMSNEKIALVRALFPRVKIIVMVRDPVERAWSHIRALTDDYRTLPDIRHLLIAGRYAQHLARWGRYFPPPQMHVVDYHDVCARPRETFAEILGFLGLDSQGVAVGFPSAPTAPPIPAELRSILQTECADEVWNAAALRGLVREVWEANSGMQS
jgi:hypothetical protein